MDRDFQELSPEAYAEIGFGADDKGALTISHQHGYITAQKVAVARDVGRVMQSLKTLAQMAGDHYYYSWEVNTRNEGKKEVTGATIKLANDLARTYGNCIVNVDCRDTDTHWLFKARFTDLETGFSLERLFQQRRSQSLGGKMESEHKDRQTDIVFQIGQSKAIRNTILNALQTFADFTVEEAKNSLIEKIQRDVVGYRTKATGAIEDLQIPLAHVERAVGRAQAEWTAKDLARIRSNIQAIRDNMATVEELFPSGEGTQAAPAANAPKAPPVKGNADNQPKGDNPKPEADKKPDKADEKTPKGDTEKPKEDTKIPLKQAQAEAAKGNPADPGEIPEALRRNKPEMKKVEEEQQPLINDDSLEAGVIAALKAEIDEAVAKSVQSKDDGATLQQWQDNPKNRARRRSLSMDGQAAIQNYITDIWAKF